MKFLTLPFASILFATVSLAQIPMTTVVLLDPTVPVTPNTPGTANSSNNVSAPQPQLVPCTPTLNTLAGTTWGFNLVGLGGGYGAIGAHGQHNGLGSHWETWMAASALGPMGALEVASLHGARFIGKEQDLGSIEVGKLADFMILNSNPLVDIRNTADIMYVVKGGVVYDDETLNELWPRQRTFGTGRWVIPDALKQDDKPIRP